MVADKRLIPLLVLALAACGGPGSNPPAPARTDNATAQQPAPPATGNDGHMVAPTDPAASRIDFAALAGRWKVVRVAVGDGVQALVANDPAYMGRSVDIGRERLAWVDAAGGQPGATVSDVCDGPVTARQSGAAAQDYDRQFGAQLATLKIADPDPHAVECNDGQWGPEAAGGAILFPAGDGIAMSWYDGAMLLLERAQ
jgi:hypothetical protein